MQASWDRFRHGACFEIYSNQWPNLYSNQVAQWPSNRREFRVLRILKTPAFHTYVYVLSTYIQPPDFKTLYWLFGACAYMVGSLSCRNPSTVAGSIDTGQFHNTEHRENKLGSGESLIRTQLQMTISLSQWATQQHNLQSSLNICSFKVAYLTSIRLFLAWS